MVTMYTALTADRVSITVNYNNCTCNNNIDNIDNEEDDGVL